MSTPFLNFFKSFFVVSIRFSLSYDSFAIIADTFSFCNPFFEIFLTFLIFLILFNLLLLIYFNNHSFNLLHNYNFFFLLYYRKEFNPLLLTFFNMIYIIMLYKLIPLKTATGTRYNFLWQRELTAGVSQCKAMYE